ncbi:MAG: nucleotidyltransferase domain-containing protein [Deltaproteobacteria bacterium]|jgi:predicted nucleotidyltransferase|nr:nucleotidyltransferase domain-containing protein [Deltaproteobacteria bacterium]
MTYTIDDIKRIVAPVARRHGVGRVWLFGSYARGEPRPDSDIDLLINKGKIRDYFQISDLYADLREALGLELDLVTSGIEWDDFMDRITSESVLIFDQDI